MAELHYIWRLIGHFYVCKLLTEELNCNSLRVDLFYQSPLQRSLIMRDVDMFLLLLKNCIIHTSSANAGILANAVIQARIMALNDYQTKIASLLAALNGVHVDSIISRPLVLPAIKIFVVGNSLSGKSTLIEAFKNGTKQTLSNLFPWERKVSQVPPHTAGILPVHFWINDTR